MSEVIDTKALQHLSRLLHDDIPLCGCGNPESAYMLVRDLLALAPFYERSTAEIQDLIGTPGALHIVLSALDEAELIEHGGGILGSWLTPKGEWCLATLRSVGDLAVLDFQAVGSPHEGDACTEACWIPAS